MSREWDLNPRPTRYECVALPLSYLGDLRVEFSAFGENVPLYQLSHVGIIVS
jgi:hypothetical protein